MRRILHGLVAVGAAGCAASPPPPVAPEPPEPSAPSARSARDNFVRVGIGGGASGTFDPDRDVEPTLGFDPQWDYRVHGVAWVGVHGHVSLRHWEVLRDAYRDLYDVDKVKDTERSSDERALRAFGMMFGWMGAWLAGTGLLGVGPHVTLAPEPSTRPWLSVGSSVLLSIDTRDPADKAVLAHALYVGLGWDLGRVGIGARAQYAPATGWLVGSTGAPVGSVTAGLEILWDEEALRKRREKKD